MVGYSDQSRSRRLGPTLSVARRQGPAVRLTYRRPAPASAPGAAVADELEEGAVFTARRTITHFQCPRGQCGRKVRLLAVPGGTFA